MDQRNRSKNSQIYRNLAQISRSNTKNASINQINAKES